MPNPLQDWAWTQWCNFYDRKPVWPAKEQSCLARAIRTMEEPQFRTGWLAYLRSTDKFFVGHRPSLFLQNGDRFISEGLAFRATVRVEDEGIGSRMSRQSKRAREMMAEDGHKQPFRTYVTLAGREMGLDNER